MVRKTVRIMYTCIIRTPPHTPQPRTAHYTLRLGGRLRGGGKGSKRNFIRRSFPDNRAKYAMREAKSPPLLVLPYLRNTRVSQLWNTELNYARMSKYLSSF